MGDLQAMQLRDHAQNGVDEVAPAFGGKGALVAFEISAELRPPGGNGKDRRCTTRYEGILDRAAVNIRERGEAYRREGWTQFNETGTPYSAEQARKEREIYGSSGMGRPL